MPSRKIVCPSCEASLKVPEAIPAGKKIRCSTCKTVFALRLEEEQVTAKAKRPATLAADTDEDLEEDYPEERVSRKSSKKRKRAASYMPWIIAGAVAVVLIGAGAALLIWWPFGKASTPVAGVGTGQPPVTPMMPAASPVPQTPVQGDDGPFAAGKKVFATNGCMRCHSTGDSGMPSGPPGGGFGKGGFGKGGFGKGGFGRGPSLAKVGADPSHTVDWLMEHIRNPRAHRPDSRMPSYEGKINEDDLRKLAEYLASLK